MASDRMIGEALAGVYLLEEEIATGSTSVIYRATNKRLDQPVAVKVLYGSFTTNATLMARFESEARVQAKLNHPHIVKVFDFVVDGDTYAIVMEFAQGTPLDQMLYELAGPMDLARIKSMMEQVLDAVGYAHSQGIVHRDIKPSNIIVSRVGGREFPKVMDFGIAKVLAEGPSQTAPGAMLGTLLFMSPEQCKAMNTVDARADIYSIGVTLYQMTTGMVPFYAESAFEIMLAHVQTPPTPPREFIPDLSDEWQAMVLRCLEKDPNARYQSMDELAAAMRSISTGGTSDRLVSANAVHSQPPLAPFEVRPFAESAKAHRPPSGEVGVEGGDRRQRLLSMPDEEVPSLDSMSISAATNPARFEHRSGEHGPKPAEGDARQGEARPRDPRQPRAQARQLVRQPSSGRPGTVRHPRPITGPDQQMPSRDGVQAAAERQGERARRAVSRGGDRRPDSGIDPRFRRERVFPERKAPARPPTSSPSPSPNLGGVLLESPTQVLGLTTYMTGAQRLRLRVPSKDDWSRFFDPNIAGGGVFCPTPEPPEVGCAVRVEITFISGPRFFVRGVVTWRRPQLNDPRARAGVGVQLHPSERNKLTYVNAWVHGRVDDKRSLRRLPLRLRVTYSGRAGRRINFTRDLNEEGIFVRSRELLEPNTKIRLTLIPPGQHKAFQLEGVVSRLVEDREDRGMGIRLHFGNETQKKSYVSLIEQLEHQFLSGELSDDVLG